MRIKADDVKPGDVVDGRVVRDVIPGVTGGGPIRYTTLLMRDFGMVHHQPHTLLDVVRPAPVCPHCGSKPVRAYAAGRQAFCGNNACDVVTWDSTDSEVTEVEVAW